MDSERWYLDWLENENRKLDILEQEYLESLDERNYFVMEELKKQIEQHMITIDYVISMLDEMIKELEKTKLDLIEKSKGE